MIPQPDLPHVLDLAEFVSWSWSRGSVRLDEEPGACVSDQNHKTSGDNNEEYNDLVVHREVLNKCLGKDEDVYITV